MKTLFLTLFMASIALNAYAGSGRIEGSASAKVPFWSFDPHLVENLMLEADINAEILCGAAVTRISEYEVLQDFYIEPFYFYLYAVKAEYECGKEIGL